MSGFERVESSASWLDAEELSFPDDFTADEATFAHDLRSFYAVERDEPPPLYAQTLLGHERPTPAEPNFELRVLYSVFRRLALPRPGLTSGASMLAWLRSVVQSLTDSVVAVPRAVATASAAFMALMAVTVVLASPSFAAGLRILLGNTGVQQVSGYPSNVRTAAQHTEPNSSTPKVDPLNDKTPLFWLGANYGDYSYLGMRELSQPDWAQGPMVELQYVAPVASDTATANASSTSPTSATDDNLPPVLDIREFQVSSQFTAVLQVVQDGYASQTTVGDNPAVYVDGKWLYYTNRLHFGRPPTWQAGVKSELIFEYAGEVFWITGDQRYGADRAFLTQVAQQLAVVHLQQLRLNKPGLHGSYQGHDPLYPNPGDGEVVALMQVGQALDSGPASFVVDLSSYLND